MHLLSVKKSGLIALMAGALIAYAQAQVLPPPAEQPAAAPGGQRGGRAPIDPRVQQRTYTFKDTNEELPYAVFVSSKVSKDKKAPLIITLHGLNGDQNTMMRVNALQLAEEGGYIMVAPMGYNSSGWYGAPAAMAAGAGGARGGVGFGGGRGAGPGRGAAPGAGPGPGAAPGVGPEAGAGPGAALGPGGGPARGPGRGAGPGAAPTTLGTPNETSLKSEKDVMNVIAIIKKEFNIDENRMYLLGHSMGGAGAIYLGVKNASMWAAIGAYAPATQPAGINPVNYSLAPAKNVPMIIIQGDMDNLVSHLTSTRPWIEQMKELGITHQYVEVPGGDHEGVKITGAADVFAFFAKYSRNAR
jgi:poly(3-hydroxybutyrate) depolymerase